MALRIGVVKGEILIRINGSDKLTKVGEIEIPIEADVNALDTTHQEAQARDAATVAHVRIMSPNTVDPRTVAESVIRARATTAERAYGRSV